MTAVPQKKKKIVIPIDICDLHDLLDGRVFNWTFTTEDGSQEIDVKITNEDFYP